MPTFDDLNEVRLEGVILRDAEVKQTPKGKTLARVTLMTTRYYLKDGERVPYVTYVDVEAWGYAATALRDAGTHGTRIRLSGQLSHDRGEEGGRHGRLKVTTNQVVLPFTDPSAKKAAPLAPAEPAPKPRETAPVEKTVTRDQAAAGMREILKGLAERRHFHAVEQPIGAVS